MTEQDPLSSQEHVTEGSESMLTEDEMTVKERPTYLKLMKPLDIKAERSEQGRTLTEKACSGWCMLPPRNARKAKNAEVARMGERLSR